MIYRYMKHVGDVVDGIKATVPDRAAPVLRGLATLIAMASDKVAKYAQRGALSSMWHVRNEMVFCPGVTARPWRPAIDIPPTCQS